MPNSLTVLHTIPDHNGWRPILRLLDLIGAAFEAEVKRVTPGRTLGSLVQRTARRRMRRGNRSLLFVTNTPVMLGALGSLPGALTGFDKVAGLVTDAFWTERIPPFDLSGWYDHLFPMTGHAPEAWGRDGVPVTVFPWGTDTTLVRPGPRTVDVLRIGRQPEDWTDDAVTKARLEAAGLRFAGRPPRDYAALMTAYGGAKAVLASSNLCAPRPDYVHPVHEYVTGRWTDAIASGCLVAGVPPKTDPSWSALTWPEAVVEFTGEKENDVMRLKDRLADYDEQAAARNVEMAKTRLDWRLRFGSLADVLGLAAPRP